MHMPSCGPRFAKKEAAAGAPLRQAGFVALDPDPDKGRFEHAGKFIWKRKPRSGADVRAAAEKIEIALGGIVKDAGRCVLHGRTPPNTRGAIAQAVAELIGNRRTSQ
jgi:hypothetical protein